MEALALLIILSTFLLWVWFTKRQWQRSSKMKRIFLVFFTLMSALAVVAEAYVVIYEDAIARFGSILPVLLVTAFLIFAMGCMVRRIWKKVVLIIGSGLLVFSFIILFFASFNDYAPMREGELAFSRENVVRKIPELADLPAFEFEDGYYESDMEHVNFRLKNPADSVKLFKIRKKLLQKQPEQCNWEGWREGDNIAYSTAFSNGKKYVINVAFKDNGFRMDYKAIDEYRMGYLRGLVVDSLHSTFPEDEMIGYHFYFYGPDYSWNALYHLKSSLTKAQMKQLRRACERTPGWSYQSSHDSITLYKDANVNGNYTSHSIQLELNPNKQGEYRYAKVEYTDY